MEINPRYLMIVFLIIVVSAFGFAFIGGSDQKKEVEYCPSCFGENQNVKR